MNSSPSCETFLKFTQHFCWSLDDILQLNTAKPAFPFTVFLRCCAIFLLEWSGSKAWCWCFISFFCEWVFSGVALMLSGFTLISSYLSFIRVHVAQIWFFIFADTWLGMGIENQFQFQNRILVVKLKFIFRLSNPMHFFYSSVIYQSPRTLLANLIALKFGYICNQKPKKLSVISVIVNMLPPTWHLI